MFCKAQQGQTRSQSLPGGHQGLHWCLEELQGDSGSGALDPWSFCVLQFLSKVTVPNPATDMTCAESSAAPTAEWRCLNAFVLGWRSRAAWKGRACLERKATARTLCKMLRRSHFFCFMRLKGYRISWQSVVTVLGAQVLACQKGAITIDNTIDSRLELVMEQATLTRRWHEKSCCFATGAAIVFVQLSKFENPAVLLGRLLGQAKPTIRKLLFH